MTKSKFGALLFASRVDLVMLLVAMVWGASYLAAKNLTPHSSIPALLALRFLLATVVLLVIWASKHEKITRAEWFAGSIFGLSVASVLIIETLGISITSATNAGLIISLAIIFTPIIESLWQRSWLPRPFFVATIGAVVGVALLVSGNGFRSPNIGDAIMLLASVMRALATTTQGRLTQGKTLSSLNLTVVQTAVCGFAMFAVDARGTIQAAVEYGPTQWGWLSFLVIFCTVFGFIALMWGIQRTSASRASLLLSTEPIWAVFVAIAIGGEQLAWISAAGAVLIIVSTYFGQGIETKHRATKVLVKPAG
jgi:drug/metabolite transporter (DMT)-like permease